MDMGKPAVELAPIWASRIGSINLTCFGTVSNSEKKYIPFTILEAQEPAADINLTLGRVSWQAASQPQCLPTEKEAEREMGREQKQPPKSNQP